MVYGIFMNSNASINNVDPGTGSDPRTSAIVTVGWTALAMLAISIPLVGVLARFMGASALGLPLLIIAGSGWMMARIWYCSRACL